jgi:hypothetical protein
MVPVSARHATSQGFGFMKAEQVLFFAVVALAYVVPLRASADNHLDFGLRLGYGAPLGVVALANNDGHSSIKLSDQFDGEFSPLWIDASYGFTSNLSVGLYFSYAIMFVAADCSGPVSCSADDTRVGLQARYRVQPERPVDLWFGVSLGYDWANTAVSARGVKTHLTLRGFDFLGVQAGLDFRVADALRVGPFVGMSIGEYTNASGSGFGQASGGSIENKAIHEWLFVGVAGECRLGL